MPKAEKGTPKDIANRMKAKGLQKLKFYCQMCHKQCRDENGFKCHLTSDSHLRQMKIFRDNAPGIMDNFSAEFEKAYIETLKRRHGTQRMNANNVYQEVIQDKHHVHMNSTKWTTLTDFVQYLGKKGICVVEETERGWYVTYIERDPALLARQEAQRRKVEADQREERLAVERREVLRMEAAKALDRAGGVVERKASEIGERKAEEGKVALKLGGNSKLLAGGAERKKGRGAAKLSLLEDDDDEDEDEVDEGNTTDVANQNARQGSADDSSHNKQPNAGEIQSTSSSLISTHKRDHHHINPDVTNSTRHVNKKQKSYEDDKVDDKRKDYWLYPHIQVRIISKKIDKGQYYKRKAIVEKVIDKYAARVEVLESSYKACDGGDVLEIDQDDLETVIPKEVGEKVRILNGKYRGRKARVVKLRKEKYRADLRMSDGGRDEEDLVVSLDYEDFSKIA
ncbi:hypothetical protein ACHAXS_001575 [Conticribra weissflogii]